MRQSISTLSRDKTAKPAKPTADWPLFPHATRRWAKKIKGKLAYFGPWDDPDGALKKYLAQKDYLLAGQVPPPTVTGDGLTVRELVNRFLTSKRHLIDTCEMTARSWRDYYSACTRIIEVFGKSRHVDNLNCDDFERLRRKLAETRGPVALGNEIQRVRSVFRFAFDQALMEKPVRYGQSFRKPSRKTLRIARNSKPKRMFEADELRTIIKTAAVQLKAMVLLGINCAFGQSDVANLPIAALDFESGWVEFPRPKTGIERRCQLWPETIAAVNAAISERPEPKDTADAGLTFITKYGQRWCRVYALFGTGDNTRGGTPFDAVGLEFSKLLTELGLKRHGLSFYALRHTFQTVAEGTRDLPAVGSIMGHTDESMAGRYREGIDDERLRAVTEFVHAWLFGNTVAKGKAALKGKRKVKAKRTLA